MDLKGTVGDKSGIVYAYVENAVGAILRFPRNDAAILAVGIVIGVTAYHYGVVSRTKALYTRGMEKFMGKWEREAQKKVITADIITKGIDEAVDKGVLSRQEAKKIYHKIGKALGNSDLLPQPSPTIKKWIRLSKLARKEEPASIPEPKEDKKPRLTLQRKPA